MTPDTIYALASGQGRAGVAVVRLSGPRARAALDALGGGEPPPRRATRVALTDPRDGAPIDDGLALSFPAPASFTGEDVVELHIHGGRSTVAALYRALGGLDGLRIADPGEFTRRAFENGKLDLTAAEGLADLVAAETEAQRRQALRQLRGGLADVYEGWRERLLTALARVEAGIDFAEEDDVPDRPAAVVHGEILGILDGMTLHLDDAGRGERLRDGASIAIVGPPNAGKSSLLNALAGRSAAIVSEAPGTTRDVIEVPLDLGGYPVRLADSAGLRAPRDPVEREGVRRALALAEAADICLVVTEAPRAAALGAAEAAMIEAGAVGVLTKIDLPTANGVAALAGRPAFRVSSVTGEGLSALRSELGRRAAAALGTAEAPPLTRARHREAVAACVAALRRAVATEDEALLAEELRLAARALGRITGRVGVEDVLDVVFREFCIGK